MAGTDTLGCPIEGYTALIISKDGVTLGSLTPASVEWHRVLDDISEAEITVSLAGTDCSPCDIIAAIGPWHHHLALFRAGELVWDGPVVNVTVSRSQATITARDLFALMDKRLVHSVLCFGKACGGAAADLTVIGKALIDDAFYVDGHGYIVEIYNTIFSKNGTLGERLYPIGLHSWDMLTEELNLGLDATCLGRKIILGSAPFGSTALLTSEDFLTDLEFEVDGLNLATFAITKGTGVVGSANWDGTDQVSLQPYYGLLEFEGNDRSELNTQVTADQAAAAVLASHYPAPVSLVTPSGAQLSPNAPVTIAELVPGVLIPVVATDLCRAVSGQYVLVNLDVKWDGTAGEVVAVTLGTLASTNSGEDSINN